MEAISFLLTCLYWSNYLLLRNGGGIISGKWLQATEAMASSILVCVVTEQQVELVEAAVCYAEDICPSVTATTPHDLKPSPCISAVILNRRSARKGQQHWGRKIQGLHCIVTQVCHQEFMIDIWRTAIEVIFFPLYCTFVRPIFNKYWSWGCPGTDLKVDQCKSHCKEKKNDLSVKFE